MKEKLNTLILMFTRFATAIFLVDSIVLLAFKGKEARLLAIDVLVILALAFACSVLFVLFLDDKEFSKKKMILMLLAYFAVVDVLVLAAGQLLNWISFCHIKTVFALETVVVIAFFGTVIYSYKIDANTAKKMNEKLKDLETD